MVTKKQKNILDSVDSMTHYSIADAVKILQDHKSTNFDESLDVAIKLGVDGGKSDQNVRGAITLPNSLGKEVIVAVFADGDAAEEAKSAGADFIGMDDLSEQFTKNEISVDVVISTQAAMKVVGKLGQVLGPKGLMPNPKTGTVTDNVSDAIKNAKSGQVRFRNDKSGIIHGCIGKVSFDDGKVSKNLNALVEELKRLKPASAKGEYIKGISISSTMGPGLKLNISELA